MRIAEPKSRRSPKTTWSVVEGNNPEHRERTCRCHADPDEIVNHLPTNCGSCKDDLADAPVEDTEYRQVFDIPKPVLGCVEQAGSLLISAMTRAKSAPDAAGVLGEFTGVV